MKLRLVFFGTAPLAVASLRRLAASPRFELLAVVTQPDKPKGRQLHLQPSAVKVAALELGLPVLQPLKARAPDFLEQLRSYQPELMVVAAYGQILPQSLLDLPRHGCLNVHTSLLPRHRGAAPIQWAIVSGDSETGVTIMKMDAGLDTGPMVAMARTPILPEDNAQTLHDRLATLGADLLVESIPRFISGELIPQPQPEGASYARKIAREDGQIRWERPATEIWNQIRGLTPWPGAFTWMPSPSGPKLLKVWEASPLPDGSGPPGTVLAHDRSALCVACGEGILRVASLQLEGGRRLAAAQFLAGHPLPPGTPFISKS